jgi:hypothetical protein
MCSISAQNIQNPEVQKAFLLVRIKRMRSKWLISPVSGWDKEGALNPAPQLD